MYTMTIQTTKGGGNAQTRDLMLDGKTLNVKWDENEEVEVFQKTQVTPEVWTSLGKLKAQASNDGTTTLTGELTGLKNDNASTYPLLFYLHSGDMDYKSQNGVLDRDDNATKSIEGNYDYANSTTVDNYTVDDNKVTVSGSVTLTSLQAIVKFTLVDAITGNPLNATSLKIKGSKNMIESLSLTTGAKLTKELTITPESATNVIYAAISSQENTNFTLTATTAAGDTYTYEKSGVTFTNGQYYAITVKMLKYYESVDLGLPSGTKWATMNIGATSMTDRGYYFAWGETTGYPDAQSHSFSWENYALSTGSGSGNDDFTKYHVVNDAFDYLTLQTVDDAATANWGGSWRMPTQTEWEELLNNCVSEWMTNYQNSGMNGLLLTSKMEGYTDKFIFLPANGNYNDTNILGQTIYISYWSSSVYSVGTKDNVTNTYTYYPKFAYMLEASISTNPNINNNDRKKGMGIRAVCK